MNACSGPIWAGWVPAPRPMNQRTTVPPLGPGPAAMGAGVMLTVDGEGSAVWAAAVAALEAPGADGDGLADELHAPTRMASAPRIVTVLRGPDRIWFIAGLLLC